jgi:membrane protease YdiL (CAAX protease family)
MLFGLNQRYDALLAVLAQTIPSAIVHIGKPAAESFAAILAGILFGCIALETQSIVYPLVLHAAVGIATDVFVSVRLARAP